MVLVRDCKDMPILFDTSNLIIAFQDLKYVKASLIFY